MEIIKHHDRIWEVLNFLPESDISYFLDIAEKKSELDWIDMTAPDHWRGRTLNLQKTSELLNVENLVSSYFLDYQRIHDISALLRYRVGDILGKHRDNSEPEDYNNIFGLIIYLNDNYDGGQIYYPDLGLEIKPKKGSMVVHDAGILHGVRPVTGTRVRYVLTSFVKGSETTKFLGETDAI